MEVWVVILHDYDEYHPNRGIINTLLFNNYREALIHGINKFISADKYEFNEDHYCDRYFDGIEFITETLKDINENMFKYSVSKEDEIIIINKLKTLKTTVLRRIFEELRDTRFGKNFYTYLDIKPHFFMKKTFVLELLENMYPLQKTILNYIDLQDFISIKSNISGYN